MSDVQVPTQAAGLFQKAHGRIVMLQRIDAQIAALLVQKRRVQAELTETQAEINDELTRFMNESESLPTTAANAAVVPSATFADRPARRNGNGDNDRELVVPPLPDHSVSGRIDVPETVS